MKAGFLPLTLALALASGCSFIPDYQRPEVETINNWQSDKQASVSAADTGWRELFSDPALVQAIELALQNNSDLRTALLNVERYRAQYRIQRAELFPEIGADASGTRQRLPDTYTGSGDTISTQYSATLGTTAYELDLFGRVRSLNQQALESFLAQEQNQRTTQLTLVANVANAYLNWVADREQLTLAEQTRLIEADNLALVKKRFELGVASELELSQAQSSFEDAEVTLSRYQRLLAVDRNALTLLVGTALPEQWQPMATLAQVEIAALTPDLPSTLLTRRPDILAAEHLLRGANANIGAARAAFFPSLNLTATAGTMSSAFSDLFAAGSGTWLFKPVLSLPLFTAGRLSAELETARIDRDLAVTSYEQTVKTAFTEVADALAQRDGYAKQLSSQERSEAAYTRYFEIADQRYRNGIDSMLTRLDAQRNLVTSQQTTISTRLALLQARVDLYRALGGGWRETSATAE